MHIAVKEITHRSFRVESSVPDALRDIAVEPEDDRVFVSVELEGDLSLSHIEAIALHQCLSRAIDTFSTGGAA